MVHLLKTSILRCKDKKKKRLHQIKKEKSGKSFGSINLFDYLCIKIE